MKKMWILVVGIVIILFVAYLYGINKTKEPLVCFEDSCFNVEVVDTLSEREAGLMYRENLDKDSGMLFIFDEEGNYPFWMKNTLIPLDMIWIGGNKTVVDVKSAVPCLAEPCPVIYPGGDALYVLEINGGLSSLNGIAAGKMAEFIDI